MNIALLGQSRNTDKVVVINNDLERLIALRIDEIEHKRILINGLGTLRTINRIILDVNALNTGDLRNLDVVVLTKILTRIEGVDPELDRGNDQIVDNLAIGIIGILQDGLNILDRDYLFVVLAITVEMNGVDTISQQSTSNLLILRQLLNGPARNDIDSRHNNFSFSINIVTLLLRTN